MGKRKQVSQRWKLLANRWKNQALFGEEKFNTWIDDARLLKLHAKLSASTDELMVVYRKQQQYQEGKSDPKSVSLKLLKNVEKPVYLGELMFFIGRENSLVVEGNIGWILTHECLLLFQNKIKETIVFILNLALQDGVSLQEGSTNRTIAVLEYILKNVLPHFTKQTTKEERNQFFTWLKSIGTLLVSTIIYQEDTKVGWANDFLLTNTMANMLNMLEEDPNQPLEHRLFKLFKGLDSPLLSELCVLDTLFGYPTIEVERGLKKLFQRTHVFVPIDEEHIMEGIGVLIRDLCLNFYKRHKRWPIIESRNLSFSRPTKFIIAGKDPLKLSNQAEVESFTYKEWYSVDLAQNASFDFIDNHLPLLNR